MDKSSLRKFFKERFKALSLEERKDFNFKISSSLKSLNFKTSEVGVYIPLPDEVDWSVCFDKNQDFLVVNFKADHNIGFFLNQLNDLKTQDKFLVPNSQLEHQPKILFIPGLGFGEDGGRVGRGKGFYDRYLENFKGLKIGITYETLLVPKVPMEDHDRYMDWIVSEKGIKKISPV